MSGFHIYMDSLKNELNYLEDSFPKVLPVLDKYDNGVADYKNLLLGFKINRADSIKENIDRCNTYKAH